MFLNTINILYRKSLIIKDLVMRRHYNVILKNTAIMLRASLTMISD